MDNSNIKHRIVNAIFICCLGWSGIQYFIERKWKWGFIYFLTFGLLGFGWMYWCLTAIVNIFLPLARYENCGISFSKADSIHLDQSEKKDYNQEFESGTWVKAKGTPTSYVVFDTETTGLKPGKDRIIELSAIKYINGVRQEDFSELINPGRKLTKKIINLTGITDEDLEDAPTIDEVINDFFDYCNDLTLVGHNIKFDMNMLKGECDRLGEEMIDNEIIDTLYCARKMWDLDNYKLPTIKAYLNMNIESHRALLDCEVTNEIYKKYIDFKK